MTRASSANNSAFAFGSHPPELSEHSIDIVTSSGNLSFATTPFG